MINFFLHLDFINYILDFKNGESENGFQSFKALLKKVLLIRSVTDKS